MAVTKISSITPPAGWAWTAGDDATAITIAPVLSRDVASLFENIGITYCISVGTSY